MSTETTRITIVRGGRRCPCYGQDLSDLPNGPFSTDADLQWRLGVLFPLRDWLMEHGAFESGSGIWVRAVSSGERPEDVAEAGPVVGTVIASCELETTMRVLP